MTRAALLRLLALSPLLLGLFLPAAHAGEEINLYSARKEELIKPLLDRFTKDTGIRVNLVTGKADELITRLKSEGRNSPADLLITVDAGNLYRARQLGLFQKIDSRTLEQAVPSSYRDPQGNWYGLSLRARPIMYVKGKISPDELSTYENLADPKWKGRICIRSSGNIYNQSLVASLIAHLGEDKVENWARGIVANMARPPQGGDRDQIMAAAAGICDIAVANTYYLGGMLNDANPAQREAAARMAVFWPNQDGRGAHVNVSGAGVTAAAKNKANAVRLLEYLVTDEAQRWYAEVNNEYPVRPGVAWSETLQSWGKFKADDLNMEKLGEYNAAAVKLMDRAGWK